MDGLRTGAGLASVYYYCNALAVSTEDQGQRRGTARGQARPGGRAGQGTMRSSRERSTATPVELSISRAIRGAGPDALPERDFHDRKPQRLRALVDQPRNV